MTLHFPVCANHCSCLVPLPQPQRESKFGCHPGQGCCGCLILREDGRVPGLCLVLGADVGLSRCRHFLAFIFLARSCSIRVAVPGSDGLAVERRALTLVVAQVSPAGRSPARCNDATGWRVGPRSGEVHLQGHAFASFRAGFAAVSSEVLTQVDRAKGRITISLGLCFQMDIEHLV